MLTRFLVAVVLMTAAACRAPAPSPTTAGSPDSDAREVEGQLRRWYDAAEKHDSASYADMLLPNFFIFEDTTFYDKPTLARLVAEGFALGTDRAALADFRTAVSGDAAWTSFRNEEIWTSASGKPESLRQYLESVVFRRVDGRWYIERYHATRINCDGRSGRLAIVAGVALAGQVEAQPLARTPPMGFNTWNKFACTVSDKLVREMADVMVSS